MSLDQRCQQFHEAALGTGKSKGPVKEIATLRKFLHKNQDQRFTDKAVSRIFDTIQLYTFLGKDKNVDTETKEGLLEDALKMPFTVFSTKQKKTMIKWLEDMRGGGGGGEQAEQLTTQTTRLSIIDLDGIMLSLMNDETGDTFENFQLPDGELGTQIKGSFESTDGVVSVDAVVDGGSITRIVRIAEEWGGVKSI